MPAPYVIAGCCTWKLSLSSYQAAWESQHKQSKRGGARIGWQEDQGCDAGQAARKAQARILGSLWSWSSGLKQHSSDQPPVENEGAD